MELSWRKIVSAATLITLFALTVLDATSIALVDLLSEYEFVHQVVWLRAVLAWLFIACATYLTYGYISWKWTGRRVIQLLPLELLLSMSMRRALEISSVIEDRDSSSPTLLALILSLPMSSNSICFSLMYARKLELLA